MNLQTVIFIGRSGCGKGTQVNKLLEYLNNNDTRKIFHLEAGGQFRNFIKKDYYSSKLAKKIYDDGVLQPEFLSVWAWSNEAVISMEENEHIIVDGTPRRESEAKILESFFDFYERPRVDIVYLNVSREWATEKMLLRGRVDDRDIEDIISRLNWFDTDVVPVLDFYRSHRAHKFHEINGEQTVEKVHEDVIKSLSFQ